MKFLIGKKANQNPVLKIKNTRMKALLYLFFLVFFVSCGGEGEDSREHLVFRYNEFANISSLDPAFAKDQRNLWPCNQLYNGLVQLDDEMEIQPDIAKNW